MVLKALSAPAQELDLHKAQWLNNYCSAHPPSEGNKVRAGGRPAMQLRKPAALRDCSCAR